MNAELPIDPPAANAKCHWRAFAVLRRTALMLLVLGQSLVAAYYMATILPYHGGNGIEIGLIALFTVLFMWISIGFWIGVYGFFLRRFGGDRLSLSRRHPDAELACVPLARTAIVMPIYHEPIARTFGGLRAVYRSLERSGQLDNFDFFILSDSRDPDVWLGEQQAWSELVRELNAEGRMFYRRRTLNMNYKSGNVGDFLRRWGKQYKYMVVLDADSLMSSDALTKMVRLMQVEPKVGILQSNPRIINGRSVFARVQQFSNQVYGPLFITGLAAFQLGDATFWGHNAIIRVDPFMRYCGLRRLRGIGLFRGPISSHDFVEAAYMGRAGYEVWLEPALQESYEESPPTVVDELSRDRRWAKGNLQHLWIMVCARRLRLAHRMAFLYGSMSYLASPLWFAFLVLSTIETTQLVLSPPNYFPEAHSLFPRWPEWHPEWAIGLAVSTLFLLFMPKILAWFDVMLTRRAREHGGIVRLFCSIQMEIVISALLAPIRMLAHAQYVLEAIFNVRLKWAGQNRTDETTWRDALTSQAPGSVIAACWAVFAWWLKPTFFYWSLPVALPLILAAPTSVFLSRTGAGEKLRRGKFFCVPEEHNGLELLHDLNEYQQRSQQRQHDETPVLRAVFDPHLNRLHQQLGVSHRGGAKQAQIKELRKRFFEEGPQALTRTELTSLMRDRESLDWLHNAIWRADSNTIWGKLLEKRQRKPGGFTAPLIPRKTPGLFPPYIDAPYIPRKFQTVTAPDHGELH